MRGNLGEKIKLLRLSKQLSQGEFAARIGVRRETIIRWEYNTSQPVMSDIEKICQVFLVPWDYFNPEKSIELVAQAQESQKGR